MVETNMISLSEWRNINVTSGDPANYYPIPAQRMKQSWDVQFEKTKQELSKLGATYIDHGFWQISVVTAKSLCAGRLPKEGYEKLVAHNNKHYWVAQTSVHGKAVWSIRDAGGWKLRDGQ